MSWIFVADDGEQVHYDVPPQVAELEQQLAALREAANNYLDTGCYEHRDALRTLLQGERE